MRRVFFIDRDGVINSLVNYDGKWDSPQKPEDVKLVEGVVEFLRWLNKNGILILEISNQPGVAKGKMSRETSDAIEAKVHELLNKRGAKINHKYICLHFPKGVIPELTQVCECRKPKPGLLLRAARELSIDLAGSMFLGDKASDVEAGKTAGVKTILYLHSDDELQKVEGTKQVDADYKVVSIREVMPIVEVNFK